MNSVKNGPRGSSVAIGRGMKEPARGLLGRERIGTSIMLSYVDRLALCRAPVTLDGEPAAICGARLTFARVVTLPHGRVCEWPWEAVRRIVAQGGDFRSGARTTWH